MVGMSKSGSRYGRRSNWFKIHCLLQEQQQQQQAGNNPVLREPLNSKNSKVLPLWEGLAPHFHDTKQPLHLPNVVDVDNNNTGSPKNFLDNKSRTLQPGHLMPVRNLPGATHPGYGSAGEAAAALWAARNTLLPLQVTSHHHATSLPPLPVPFLTSPFLHGTGFHHPHHGGPPASRNFLLPFVQSMANSPKHHGAERLTSPASSSSSTSSSSSSHSPSPIRDGKLHKDTVERSRPEAGFKHSDEPKLAIYDKSVAILQSLGPVQDQPIDLSLRGGLHNKTAKHRRRKDFKGRSSSEENIEDQDEVGSGSDGGVDSCDDDRGAHRENEILKERPGESDTKKPISAPLDLTTRT